MGTIFVVLYLNFDVQKQLLKKTWRISVHLWDFLHLLRLWETTSERKIWDKKYYEKERKKIEDVWERTFTMTSSERKSNRIEDVWERLSRETKDRTNGNVWERLEK